MKRILLLAMLLLMPTRQNAQVIAQASTNSRTVTISMNNVALRDALETVSRQAGVTVSLGESALGSNLKVSVTVKNATAQEAVNKILKGTGFRSEMSPAGNILVVPGKGSAKEDHGRGIITGKVTDAKSGKGIGGATVSLGTNSYAVTTEEDGTFRLAGIPEGTHVISVRLVGYAKQTRSITVSEGAKITADFKLEPSASVLDQVVVTGTVIATELRAVPNAITVITAKQIEERGITRIDQLFRGDIPGIFAINSGSTVALDNVTMFSRGATALSGSSAGTGQGTNPIKTYIDGIEMANSEYLSHIDPKSIERIEILTGPQASTIYGSNAINGVMQVFTKRGNTSRPQLTLNLSSGFVQNNFSNALTPHHDYGAQINGIEGRISYNTGGSWYHMGRWSPAKQTARTGAFGGMRFELPVSVGKLSTDLTLRRTLSKNLIRGATAQASTAYNQTGWFTSNTSSGLSQPTTYSSDGKTFGLTLSYAPIVWWSHEVGFGQDVSDLHVLVTGSGYRFQGNDTLLSLSHFDANRRSMRYATTARIPVSSRAQLTLTAGADNWQSLNSRLSAAPNALTGTLTGTINITRTPAHNTGAFAQTQLSLIDRLFLTYGVRLEKNPTIGDKARTMPGRYGAAYTQEFGNVTAKLRGSYGRSIRPPTATLKDAVPQTNTTTIGLYGPYNTRIANPELAPEYQQGGEGGLELYLGTRGSLVLTRYNQTVDQLIASVEGIDSVPSLELDPTPTTAELLKWPGGHTYAPQAQYLNIGSIRNQGWELQGSMGTGPFTTRGTYSWIKSRVIGVTPRYRSVFAANSSNNAEYQPGSTFKLLPEHTWALGITYAYAQSTVALNINGLGQSTKNERDELSLRNFSPSIRLPNGRLRMDASNYVNSKGPYALADLNASHRFSPKIEALLQVQNLGDTYVNDFSANFATLGRQTKLGFRLRTR